MKVLMHNPWNDPAHVWTGEWSDQSNDWDLYPELLVSAKHKYEVQYGFLSCNVILGGSGEGSLGAMDEKKTQRILLDFVPQHCKTFLQNVRVQTISQRQVQLLLCERRCQRNLRRCICNMWVINIHRITFFVL